MHNFPSLFGSILRPWLCLAVYLWALELQASYGTDFEPLLDRLADAATILWSLVLWTLVICVGVTLPGLLWRWSTICRINQSICRISCILVSALFMTRWLNGWVRPELTSPAIDGLVILAIALVYFMVRRRRRLASAPSTSNLSLWQDCFSFGVLPVLFASIIVLGIRIAISIGPGKIVWAATHAGNSLRDSKAEPPLPNVIFIVSDSLRAQSLSLYGNPSVSTPALERFAERGSIYLETHANSTSTTPSMTTLLTGRHPFEHGRLSREIAPRPDENNLLRVLRNRGYSTAAVSSNGEAALSSSGLNSELTSPEHLAFRFSALSWLCDLGVYPTRLGGRMYEDLSLFLPFLGFPPRASVYGHIQETLEQAKEVLVDLKEPFFLVIHIHEPHVFSSTIQTVIKRIGKKFAVFYAQYDSSLQPEVDGYRAEYEASVRDVDSGLGKFFGFLQRHSWLESSLVIFTADHGESFERGYLGHGEELHENSTRVPLVIRFPHQKTGEKVAGLTQSIDIAPTILRALTIPVPDWMGGQPLMPGVPPENRATVTINFKHPDGNGFYPLPTRIAIWRDQYKLIVTCASGALELYDVKRDPLEQFNLWSQRTNVVEDLKRELKLEMAKQSHEPTLVCPNL